MIMYMYALRKFPKIKSITHKFSIKGHTQNEGDVVHLVIEKEIKRACKSRPLFIPAQYVQLMRTTKKTQRFYQVNKFSHDSLIGFRSNTLTSTPTWKSSHYQTSKYSESDEKIHSSSSIRRILLKVLKT